MRIVGRDWSSRVWLLAIAGNLLACGSQSDEDKFAGSAGRASEHAAAGGKGGANAGGAAGDHGGGVAGASGGQAGIGAGETGVSESAGAAGAPHSAAGAGGGSGGGSAGASGGSAGTSGGQADAAGTAGAAGGGGLTSCAAPLSVGDVTNLTATEQVETYAVMGSTASQLRSSINANRGHDYDAQTNWYIHWSYKNCAAPEWTVTLTIDYSLPNWDWPASADPVLVTQWRTYLSALYCHEYGHGKLGLDCANRIYDDLASIPGNVDCNAVSSAANARFQSILADCQAKEANYDAQTNHGATMGALFPP